MKGNINSINYYEDIECLNNSLPYFSICYCSKWRTHFSHFIERSYYTSHRLIHTHFQS